ncbi:pectinesterase family protein [Melissococcus plutonius]|uniref:pectinesterase family protein n=1 Tax=Melissococcus plutonius TaxID=33970 RepID=UPI003EE66C24
MAKIYERTPIKKFSVGKGKLYDFTTIQAAIDEATNWDEKIQILIFPGDYQENVRIYGEDIELIGIGEVVITSNLAAYQINYQGEERGTFQTATVFINGQAILLKNLSIVNTAGPGEIVGQAVALYIEGTDIHIDSCKLDGYQDTLCLGPLPKFQKDGKQLMVSPWLKIPYTEQIVDFHYCQISGTVDFIFGGGQASFYHCQLYVKKNTHTNYITAASTPKNQKGFYFVSCMVTGDSPYYLGRPWRQYAAVTFVNSYFDQQLYSTGWHDWDKPKNRQTVNYQEINCLYLGEKSSTRWATKEMSEQK